ncbi:MAG TPA: helix-turn-helix transcriptional regulator [Acidobacteriota bacterium]|nr:helix-turn-helix transcriptional regulator [Acidobacteriota bacterium]
MSGQRLGEFELLVLLAALRLGKSEAYAVSIVDEIQRRTGRVVQRASVYVTLQRLETKGLVSSHLGDPLPERGGKGRRYVAVEPAGVRAVRDARSALESMWGGLAPRLEDR